MQAFLQVQKPGAHFIGLAALARPVRDKRKTVVNIARCIETSP
jgi:hypothetical protein